MKRNEETYLPIPSLNYKYEINLEGTVRRVATKHELQPYVLVSPEGRGKTKHKSIYQLLWEVHGITRKDNYTKVIPVLVSKGSEQYYFETLKACAKYLSKREHYTPNAFLFAFTKRQVEVHGWRVEYFAEPPIPKLTAHKADYDFKRSDKNDTRNCDEED